MEVTWEKLLGEPAGNLEQPERLSCEVANWTLPGRSCRRPGKTGRRTLQGQIDNHKTQGVNLSNRAEPGTKLGTELGTKPGTKLGTKLGTKPGTKSRSETAPLKEPASSRRP